MLHGIPRGENRDLKFVLCHLVICNLRIKLRIDQEISIEEVIDLIVCSIVHIGIIW